MELRLEQRWVCAALTLIILSSLPVLKKKKSIIMKYFTGNQVLTWLQPFLYNVWIDILIVVSCMFLVGSPAVDEICFLQKDSRTKHPLWNKWSVKNAWMNTSHFLVAGFILLFLTCKKRGNQDFHITYDMTYFNDKSVSVNCFIVLFIFTYTLASSMTVISLKILMLFRLL